MSYTSYTSSDHDKNMTKVTKINLRITARRHTHLQTLAKTSAKFHKDMAKTVGVVALKRHPVSKQSFSQEMTKFKPQKSDNNYS